MKRVLAGTGLHCTPTVSPPPQKKNDLLYFWQTSKAKKVISNYFSIRDPKKKNDTTLWVKVIGLIVNCSFTSMTLYIHTLLNSERTRISVAIIISLIFIHSMPVQLYWIRNSRNVEYVYNIHRSEASTRRMLKHPDCIDFRLLYTLHFLSSRLQGLFEKKPCKGMLKINWSFSFFLVKIISPLFIWFSEG